MALLSALFFGAMNRFSEQIQVETNVKNELNHWFIIRANLWRELDAADSIHIEKDKARLYLQEQTISYFVQDDRLFRSTEKAPVDLEIPMNSITSETRNGHTFVVFSIDWKKEAMMLRYPLHSAIAGNVNDYFSRRLWQQ